jgi:hypothetical protein
MRTLNTEFKGTAEEKERMICDYYTMKHGLQTPSTGSEEPLGES